MSFRPQGATRPNRSRRALWPLGFASGAVAAALILKSDHTDLPELHAGLTLLLGWSFIGTGLFAWSHRPGNRIGPLMVAVGLAWFLAGLMAANYSIPFTIGVLLSNLVFALVAHLLLSFPGGRLESPLARLAVIAVYVDVTALQLAWMLFAGPSSLDCAECPENALLIDDNDRVADVLMGTSSLIGLVAVAAAVGIFVRRWRAATPPTRRALGPVLWSGGITASLLGLALVFDFVSNDVSGVLFLLALLFMASIPFAFIAGLLLSRFARLRVVRLLIELVQIQAPGRLRDALARAFRDPSLTLAYWIPETQSYVDASGRPVDVPPEGSAQVATIVEREGRRIGALVHDVSLLENRELVEAVSAATGLALENERLQAELLARLADLERERDFISAVLDTAATLVIVTDRAGRFVRFNEACEHLTGYTFEEVVGRPFWDLFIAGEEAERVQAAVARVWAGEYPSENENHWILRDGSRRLIAWSNTALFDPDGEIEYMVSSGLDVTERKRAEQEVRASRARIVEAGDAERRRLERNLHDGAQQRLVALSLALRMARSQVRYRPGAAEDLLEDAGGELAQALTELRELARGIHPAVLTDRGLEAAVGALAERAPAPVDLRIDVGERLPPSVEAAAYYVVSESLANIAKYAQAGAVSVSVERSNGEARIEVSDDGVGGADAALGSGLRGLADRVEALDGRLEVMSEPGRGTTVRAEIPVHERRAT